MISFTLLNVKYIFLDFVGILYVGENYVILKYELTIFLNLWHSFLNFKEFTVIIWQLAYVIKHKWYDLIIEWRGTEKGEGLILKGILYLNSF